MAREPLNVALEFVSAAYSAAGVPAVIDVRDLNPPGALVLLDSVVFDVLSAEVYRLKCNVFLTAGDLGMTAALPVLSDLLDIAADVWPTTGDVLNQPLTHPNGGDPWPALVLSIETKIVP